jgi:prepilin-type processing-associated H-X9-DG protein/prepilin-type N-terminal cleavage/methylation domain-containing protein
MLKNFHCRHPVNAQSRPRPAGFTLTEALIAIVIIAILAAIMFALVRGIREKAQAAVCAQNLKQIGIGLHAHISENNGRLPNGKAHVSWLKDDENNSLGLSWYDAAAKNLGRENHSNKFNDPAADPLPDIFGCPSGHGKPYHPEWPYTGDYAANLYLGQENHKVLTMSAVKNPASTPYVQDTVKQNNFGVGIYAPGFSKTADFAFAARHGGRGNILWLDGHVSSLTYAEYMDFANDSQRGGPYNFVRGNW